ncbi:MAG: DUF4870 domain-containing protein [Patescibacteria group bacterium]|nr:DUF4870 domain-containing protein [Patescibacteria group bacterium]MDD5490774.1 DUF4870 domain-containing protein [Patescibacteria group bacterium]
MDNQPINKDIEDNKVLAAIGYIWILFLIPLLAKKDSPFCQFHGKQGMVLFVAWVFLVMVGWIPFLGWLIAIFGSFILVIFSLVGLIKALTGESWELPFLGQYAKKINL